MVANPVAPTAPLAPPSAAPAEHIQRTPLVQIRGLTKRYTEGGTDRAVLNATNATFYEGDFIVLLGKSGSGKSTLLNLIGGIDEASAGEVWIRDTNVTTLKEPDLTLFRREKIGFIFQFFNLIPTLTALENISLQAELRGENRKTAEKGGRVLLDRVGLANRADTYPDRLSGGEQQRIAIARALVNSPMIILADEPTGNLDEDTGKKILDLLLELTRQAGRTLIMATHNPEVVPYADVVYHIVDGQIMPNPNAVPVAGSLVGGAR